MKDPNIESESMSQREVSQKVLCGLLQGEHLRGTNCVQKGLGEKGLAWLDDNHQAGA